MSMRFEKTLIEVPTESCHASNVAIFGGRVYVVWFGGTREGAPDVGIYMTVFENGRQKDIVRMEHEEGLPHWNPVLYVNAEMLHLYYKVGKTIPKWHTRHMYTTDGVNWTGPYELVEMDEGGRGPVRNKPLALSGGQVLAPASVETDDSWRAFVDISEDGGHTFRASGEVPVDAARLKGKGVIQPALWQTPDGAVHMLLRSTEGCIMRSDSSDAGESWCEAYDTGMPNNNSGLALSRMGDGRLILVCNPVRGNWAARTPLSVFVSSDEGASFMKAADIETDPGEFSYPSISCDGNEVYISYTFDRRAIALIRTSAGDITPEV